MQFEYQALGADGSTQRGFEEADAEADAVAQLLRRGLTPVSMRAAPRRNASGNPPAGSGATAWQRRESAGRVALVLTVRELASLLAAGVTLEESLRTLIQSRRGLHLEPALTAVLTQVLGGERFSAAVRAQVSAGPLALPSYVVALISAGESTGDLANALGRAAEQMEFDEQVRAETSEALVYPAILITAGIGAVLFVFSFVVPRFSSLLAGRRAELPWLSSVVMATGEAVNAHGTAIALAIGVVVAAAVTVWRLLGGDRIRSGLAGLPVLGTWIRQQELSRWTGMLSLMLQSRVPILTALDLTASAVGLADVRGSLRGAIGDIGRGETMSRSFAERRLLPVSALSMVRVGEQTGQVGPMMGHVARHALEQNRRQRKRLVALIEPASILVLGGIIAAIIVGVVLAITSLNDIRF
ncbi:MAG: type II secretion system F family protein [Rubrivivax sp.]